jgi:DNA-binding PadR family transcriptional regulator
MAKRRKVSNLLGLAILAQLSTGRPMHPYEIATVLKQQGKEADMNIKWGSLYTVVQNLEKYGFIEATASNRDGRRPERTVYAITEAGRVELRDWMRELVGVLEPETNRFEAALSVMGVLPPDEAIGSLSGVDGWRAYHETGEMPAEFAQMLDEGASPEPGEDSPPDRPPEDR